MSTIIRKILVVEDDRTTLRLVQATLEKQGYIVWTAQNGREALDQVEREHPDLLVLDIEMPEMSGIEALKTLRLSEPTASIPIFMLTGRSGVANAYWAREMGANRYLTKPFQPDILLQAIRDLTHEASQDSSAATKVSPASESSKLPDSSKAEEIDDTILDQLTY